MEISELIQALNANPTMQLATVDAQGQPHTRGIFMYRADEEGILFHTGNFKTLYAELKARPGVEASFMVQESYTQIRVRGRAVELDDRGLRDRIVATPGREFLKPVITAKGLESIRVFRIEGCRAVLWTIASNLAYPKPEIAW
jgi:pyridoxamine 5'-phosphate oxidase